MAAPPELTIKDLSGKYVMNKSLSDDTDSTLALQGVGWFTRRALSMATVTLDVKQYLDEDGITHIDIQQTATGGIKGTAELRTLNWTESHSENYLFGPVTGMSRWSDLSGVEDAYLKEGWLDGEEEAGGPGGEKYVENFVVADRGWTARQIWGFAIIDGTRRHVRRLIVVKGDEVHKLRLVYDWQGKA